MKSDTHDDQIRLQRAIALTRRSRWGRIAASPVRGGYARLVERFCRLAGTSKSLRTTTFWGEPFTVVLPEELSIHIARYGFFEEGLTRALMEFLKPGDMFFDVGAHFGYYSLLASRLVGESGRVHSFEPTPSTFRVLQSNVGHKSNVTLNNVAVFDADTTLTFSDYGARHSMFNSVYGVRAAAEYRTTFDAPVKFETRALRLDSYVSQTRAIPNFVKVDAEGAEPQVLGGMDGILAQHRPIVSIEVGDWGVEGMLPSRQVIQSVLTRGYRAVEYCDGRFVPHEIAEKYGYDNIVMLPD